jgi:TRAP transporter TAXI family solute receptor
MSVVRVALATWLLVFVGIGQASSADDLSEQRNLVNQGTVTVVGGSISGTYSQLVWDMSTVFDDGYKLRVLPILGKGSFKAIEDLLLLRGVDAAVVQSDVMDFITSHNVYPNIDSLVSYITILFNEEVHLVARNGVNSIKDLQGKRVNFGPPTSGNFLTASIIFDRNNIEVEALDLSHEEGLKQLREGKLDAIVRVSGAPTRFLEEISWQDGLHIIPLEPIKGSYLEAKVSSEQYPGLIAQGETVPTIAVAAVMAAYNWPEGHPRRAKLQRLVDELSERLPELQKDPFHEKWQQVQLQKELPGWRRWKTIR